MDFYEIYPLKIVLFIEIEASFFLLDTKTNWNIKLEIFLRLDCIKYVGFFMTWN